MTGESKMQFNTRGVHLATPPIYYYTSYLLLPNFTTTLTHLIIITFKNSIFYHSFIYYSLILPIYFHLFYYYLLHPLYLKFTFFPISTFIFILITLYYKFQLFISLFITLIFFLHLIIYFIIIYLMIFNIIFIFFLFYFIF